MNKLIDLIEKTDDIQKLGSALAGRQDLGVYAKSIHSKDGSVFFLRTAGLAKSLVIVGQGAAFDLFAGTVSLGGKYQIKEAPLDHHNAAALRKLFSWTAPQPFGSEGVSLGLGDRLGLASPGHLDAVAGTEIRPVLAQQSMRELNLTNRSYADVLDAATFAVFQEGYKLGFGADGDHLKTGEDIEGALALGFSMITLDCSEHINNKIGELSAAEVLALYRDLPQTLRTHLETEYLDKEHLLCSGRTISFAPEPFYRMVLVYNQAIDFAAKIYQTCIAPLDRAIDFEISIDEVSIPTTPQDHYFVATELLAKGLKICGIAPRFCGAFEKGIDYRGDLGQFEEEFAVHAEIAEHYGYKVSVHSGSDKFSIFPIVGKYCPARLHVKTAGTNWLEALKVIAEVNPDLFRQLYQVGLENLEGARKYYVVSLDIGQIPDVSELDDDKLEGLLEQPDVRQALHITYGFMLGDGQLRVQIYKTLHEHEELYRKKLSTHIGRHIEALGLKS